MNNDIIRKEMEEAVRAGEHALYSLRSAQEKLNSASNWGVFDMFGGGLFSTMIKRSKMEEAQGLMETAKSDLTRFKKELKDVNISLDLRMEIGSFLSLQISFLMDLLRTI